MLFKPSALTDQERGPIVSAALAVLGGGVPDQVADCPDVVPGGYMITTHWNPEHQYRVVRPFDEQVTKWLDTIEVPEYGVCDSIQQFHELHGRKLDADILPWCVFFVHIAKDPNSDGGGWRWHKWGEYIGTGSPSAEYLDDEPPGSFDDGVYTFHVYYVDQNEGEP